MSWVAAARSAARRWVTDTWRGASSVDPQAGAGRRRSARSQRTSAWPPFSCGRMYGTYWSVTVDRQMPTRPPRLRSGYVSCGPDRTSAAPPDRTRPRGRCPTRARSVRSSGRSRSPRRRCHRRPGACRRPRAGRRSRPPVTYSLRTTVRGPAALDADQAPLEPVDPELRPARGHPADPVVVGRGAPERQGRRGGQQRMDEPAVGVERHGSGGGPARQRWRPRRSPRRRPGAAAQQTSKPAGAQGRSAAVVKRTVSNASSLAGRRGTQPGRSTVARSPGPRSGRPNAPAATSSPSTVSESARPEPVEVAEVLVVGELDPTRGQVVRRARDADRRGQPLVLPHGRLRPAVRPDQPVAHEVAVVGLRPRSRRRRPSAVRPSGSVWTRPWSQNSQMKPPWSPGVDSIASQYSASVPLLLPIACEYSHMISGCRWRPGPGVADDRRDRRIHRAGEVADALVARPVEADRTLVVERPGRVVAAQPGRGRLVVRAVAGLVAERPEDDRRVVLVAQGHPRHAVDPRER